MTWLKRCTHSEGAAGVLVKRWGKGKGLDIVQPTICAAVHGFRAANTTLDTSLFRLVVLLYCLQLHASSRPQTFGLLGGVNRS